MNNRDYLPDIEEIKTRTHKLMEFLFVDSDHKTQPGLCVQWSVACSKAMDDLGYSTCINAGSAAFLANHSEPPNPTHLSYVFDEETDCQKWLDIGKLPEIHSWVVETKKHLIIDPSVLLIPTFARSQGIEWVTHEFDDWYVAQRQSDRALYMPSYRATQFVYDKAERLIEAAHLRRAIERALGPVAVSIFKKFSQDNSHGVYAMAINPERANCETRT
jgi:hypothetical protein